MVKSSARLHWRLTHGLTFYTVTPDLANSSSMLPGIPQLGIEPTPLWTVGGEGAGEGEGLLLWE